MKGATAHWGRLGRGWLRRTGLVLLLAAVVETLAAGPAAAHAVGSGVTASNYRTNVLGISPAVPGLEIRAVDVGDRLQLSNRTGQEVIVLGYQLEPYLRVGPNGVEENQRAPSAFSNRSSTAPQQIPPAFDAKAAPEWRRIAAGTVALWHDHRAHWSGQRDPAAVRQAPAQRHVVQPGWQVPIKIGDRTVIVSGNIVWVPGPSPWPWVAVGLLLVGAVLLAGGSRWQAQVLSGVAGLAVAADAVHTAGSWLGSSAPIATQLYSNASSFAGWVLAGIAIHRLLSGRVEASRPYLLLAAIFLVLAGAAPDLPSLTRSQLPSGLDPTLTRAAIVTTLGLGTGMAIAALLGRQLRIPAFAGRLASAGRRPPGAMAAGDDHGRAGAGAAQRAPQRKGGPFRARGRSRR
ncbi:MAG TPA: hypothetical protein VFA46_06895 [Actinomycetes bacterium]|jgi:hypothetical protein|nr:hypothetical protein [Actinomycetes bacterium]